MDSSTQSVTGVAHMLVGRSPTSTKNERSGLKPIPSFVPPGTGYYAILAAYCVICGCDMYAGQTRSHTVDHK